MLNATLEFNTISLKIVLIMFTRLFFNSTTPSPQSFTGLRHVLEDLYISLIGSPKTPLAATKYIGSLQVANCLMSFLIFCHFLDTKSLYVKSSLNSTRQHFQMVELDILK